MERIDKTLAMALNEAGLKELPEEVSGAFEGLAVVLVSKFGGKETYAIGKWSKKTKKVDIAVDFDNKMIERIIAVYPYERKMYEDERKKETALKKKIEEEIISKLELKNDDAKGTLKLRRAYLKDFGYNKAELDVLNNLRASKLIEDIEKAQKRLEILGGKVENKKLEEINKDIDDILKNQ